MRAMVTNRGRLAQDHMSHVSGDTQVCERVGIVFSRTPLDAENGRNVVVWSLLTTVRALAGTWLRYWRCATGANSV
jgi:hypothetical protein